MSETQSHASVDRVSFHSSTGSYQREGKRKKRRDPRPASRFASAHTMDFFNAHFRARASAASGDAGGIAGGGAPAAAETWEQLLADEGFRASLQALRDQEGLSALLRTLPPERLALIAENSEALNQILAAKGRARGSDLRPGSYDDDEDLDEEDETGSVSTNYMVVGISEQDEVVEKAGPRADEEQEAALTIDPEAARV